MLCSMFVLPSFEILGLALRKDRVRVLERRIRPNLLENALHMVQGEFLFLTEEEHPERSALRSSSASTAETRCAYKRLIMTVKIPIGPARFSFYHKTVWVRGLEASRVRIIIHNLNWINVLPDHSAGNEKPLSQN